MLRATALVAALIAVAGVARADTGRFKEQLTEDQIAAAIKAVRDKLPPVDAAAMKACPVARVQDAPKELASAAACYRAAGNLGRAIQTWEQIVLRSPRTAEATDAQRQLGPAYEAAGMFDKAASSYRTLALSTVAAEPFPADLLIRAICIERQLGRRKEAERDLAVLRTAQRKTQFDSETLCDSVRPIAPPT